MKRWEYHLNWCIVQVMLYLFMVYCTSWLQFMDVPVSQWSSVSCGCRKNTRVRVEEGWTTRRVGGVPGDTAELLAPARQGTAHRVPPPPSRCLCKGRMSRTCYLHITTFFFFFLNRLLIVALHLQQLIVSTRLFIALYSIFYLVLKINCHDVETFH